MLRIYSLGLLLTFLLCYFHWGNNSAFLVEIQYELILKTKDTSLLHPLIIGPAIGELLLLFTVLRPNKKLILTGLILLMVLVLMVLLAGILGLQLKMIASTIPYIIISVLYIHHYKKLINQPSHSG